MTLGSAKNVDDTGDKESVKYKNILMITTSEKATFYYPLHHGSLGVYRDPEI